MSLVRIGIVGAGFAARFHLASYRKVYGETFEVVALCSRNTQRANDLAAEFGVSRCTRDVGELLRDPTIDAIDICLPNHMHAPLALRAAEHGKHVICEKPLSGYFGPTPHDEQWSAKGARRAPMLEAVVAQINAIREAVQRAGITFCYAENWVYAPPVVKVERLMAASQSTILRIEAEESHSGSHSPYAKRWATAGGGSLLRLGAHPIGAALHLKAQEGHRRSGAPIRPVNVCAQATNLTQIEAFMREAPQHIVTGWDDVEDFATLFIRFEDGAVAQITSTDTRLGGIRNFLTAHGSRAQATANINPNTSCQAFTPDGAYFSDEYIVEKTQTKQGWSFPAPDEDAITGYPEELRDFIGAISNQRAPLSGLPLASDVLLVIYAGYLSAEIGQSVDLRPYLR